MRRAARLFEIIQILRRGSVFRAQELAAMLEVSERTIYRDIGHMVASGVPIDGAAGVGYILRPGFELPPLMFTEEEIEALLLGARIVQSWADPALAKAARSLTDKVRAVVPAPLGRQLDRVQVLAPAQHAAETITIDQAAVRRAVRDQRKIGFTYRSLSEQTSERIVRPLIMAFYGPVWLLAAWCEVRRGFRVFRLDRMTELSVLDETFAAEAGTTAEDFLRQDRTLDFTRMAGEGRAPRS